MITRRSFIAAGVAATVLPAMPARADTIAIRMGYLPDYLGCSLVAIANDQDLWSKHGLSVDLKRFTNGPLQVQALTSQSLDFGFLGAGAMWLPADGKAKVIAINAIGFTDRVIARYDIKTLEDIRGKKVGIPEGTSGDMMFRLALQKAGMTASDVDIVTMDPSTLVTAFVSGQVDVAGIWYPLVGVIRERVPDLNEISKTADFYPEYAFPNAFFASNEIIDANPEAVKRLIAVLKEANDFRAADMDRAVRITADFIGIPADKIAEEASNVKTLTTAELAQMTEDGTIQGWLKTMNDMFRTFGKLQGDVDPSTYYVTDFYLAD